MPLERMTEFFASRVDIYEEHMKSEVVGAAEGYVKMAEVLPEGIARLLDLGCGTGLELDEIYKRFPNVRTTGVDLTAAMLDVLRTKPYSDKLNLICADYFNVDFGVRQYDAAVSFETMHHFPHEEKLSLYRRICNSLKHGGVYVEADYMAATQEDEDFYYAEYARLKALQNSGDNALYHLDAPCTPLTQIRLLTNAGFTDVRQVFHKGNTIMLAARRG